MDPLGAFFIGVTVGASLCSIGCALALQRIRQHLAAALETVRRLKEG